MSSGIRKNIWCAGCLALPIVVMAAAGPPARRIADPRDIVFPYEWVGNIDRINFNQPSGIVFHPQRRTLFVVGDEGDICEIKTDGSLVKRARVRPADFEGITCNPGTGLLYVAVEGEEKILEVNPEGFKVLREFAIERTFEGVALLKPGGQGIEAITFVPGASHREGGTFYVANQGFTFDIKEDPSVIVEVQAPLRSGGAGNATARIVRYFSVGVADLSGLHYDSLSRHIYVISDATNTFFEITRAGRVLRGYAFPGDNQEGITVDQEGFVYVAQDSGGIIKMKWKKGDRLAGK